MKYLLTLLLAAVFSSAAFSQSEVKIGKQIWMTKNLDVSIFRNGETITQAMNMNDWSKASQNKKAAWCYYDFDSKKGQKYGKLYNWYAVSDKRGLAPEGYHVPSEQEWNQLLNYESIGGENTAGRILKSKTGWTVKTKNKTENNGGGIDKVGFNALPGGGIVSTNTGTEFIFEGYGFIGIWWSTTFDSEYSLEDSLIFTKHMYNHNEVQSFSHPKYDGFSVICIKDSDLYIPTLKSKNTDLNSSAFSQSEVKIGKQIWMTKNLDVSIFRNGGTIRHASTKEDWQDAASKGEGAWCYYNYDPKNGETYGKLYNWYAVKNSRGLAPKGYHIPSDAEWTILTDFLGGESVAGKKMRSTSFWAITDTIGVNSSGFNGLMGGNCEDGRSFDFITESGSFWSSSGDGNGLFAFCRGLANNDDAVFRGGRLKYSGLSVRCIKD